MRIAHVFAFLFVFAVVSSGFGQGQFIDLGPGQSIPGHSPAPIVFGSENWTSAPFNSAAAKATHAALEKPLAKFSVSQAPIAEALASLAKDAGVNLDVNWTALESAGVERSTRVTLSFENVPVAKVLQSLLDKVGMNARLGFLVDGNVVAVSIRDDLQSSRYQITVAYDVGFLFADVEIQSPQAQDIRDMIKDTLQSTFAPETWRDAGGVVGMVRFLAGQMIVVQTIDNQEQIAKFVGEALQGTALKSLRVYDVHDLAADKDHVDGLIDVIETTCGRDTWRDRGGSSGSIAAFEGKLYINASPVVHEQIDLLLGLMRKK